MRALIVYDSAYGNTAAIAREIGRGLSENYQVSIHAAQDIDESALDDADLLVVGSPTQGGRPTIPIQHFLKNLPELDGLKAAVFDTRFSLHGHNIGLKLIMRTVGYAAEKMADSVREHGARLITPPEGFIVLDKTGPLADGETERAKEWARNFAELASRLRTA